MQQHLDINTFLQERKYRIKKVLGQGSFGVTYLAEHTILHKTIAIKEFFMKEINSREGSGSVTGITQGSLAYDYAQKFQKEASNLASIDHPNIVRVTDSFAENNTYYYVMDYIDGENLNDYIQTHSLSEQEVIDIISKVAVALQYMHERKHMLHLDLKPGNIMRRSSDGHIFLIDFGLSKHFSESGQPETSTTIGLGTAGYAPLEQSNQSKSGEFLPTIDVYALGATMYKLLTRETPPTATDLVMDDELLEQQLSQYNVSKQLQSVILHAMTIKVKNRTQTVGAFLSELQGTASTTKEDKTLIDQPTKAEDKTIVIETPQPQKKPLIMRETFTVKGVSFDMIHVEGGTFTMGATSEHGSDVYDSEKSAHSVTLSSYSIGETQVTQALWQAVIGDNPSYFKGDDQRPVEKVSWNDCQEFIRKLNSLTGKNFRMPTEAEWEYAARGGNKSRGYKYSGSNNIGDVAWYDSNSYSKGSSHPDYGTHPVKQKQANELGLYDMSGNVFEWCQDWYDANYYSVSPRSNPKGPSSGYFRVFRGGCWIYYARFCRSSYRGSNDPDNGGNVLGFRLALSEYDLSSEQTNGSSKNSASVSNTSNTSAKSSTNRSLSVTAGGEKSFLGGNTNPDSDHFSDKLSFTAKGVSFNMIAVEGGTFTMGATSEQVSEQYLREQPTHSVTLSSFSIGETEVTLALWKAVMGENPSSFKGNPQCPVVNVSWNDCQDFISKLNNLLSSQLGGKRFRLPTEAEWEFAARGGNKSRGYKYSGSNSIDDVAWYNGNSNSQTHPVKQKQANELGIYDMSGNVWEWCSDWYSSSYYGSSPSNNPKGPSDGPYRVIRGGCWGHNARDCRSSNRLSSHPDFRNCYLGLRLALSE